MVSSTNIIILLGCVVLFAVRSYKKGIWQGVLSLAGLLCAYGVCFLLAPQLGGLVKTGGLSGAVAVVIAMVVVFFVTTTLVAYVPTLIFPSIRQVKRKHQYLGAAFGIVTGAIFGILMIWLTSLVTAALGGGGGAENPATAGILGRASSQLVAGAVRSGMRMVEDDAFKANAAAALLSSPQTFTASFAQLSKSPELQNFWHDGETQFYMAEGEVEKIVSHGKFRALMALPAMREMLEQSRPRDITPAAAETYLASQMSFVYRRMRALRTDARVVAILDDPEVRALAQKQNPVALLTNKKIQALVAIVMEEGEPGWQTTRSEAMPTASAVPPRELEAAEEGPALAPRIIYRWQDDNGKTRYTDPENTPDSKIHSAEIIAY